MAFVRKFARVSVVRQILWRGTRSRGEELSSSSQESQSQSQSQSQDLRDPAVYWPLELATGTGSLTTQRQCLALPNHHEASDRLALRHLADLIADAGVLAIDKDQLRAADLGYRKAGGRTVDLG